MALNRRWWTCILLLAAAGCDSEEEALMDGVFTSAEWASVKTLSPLPDKPAVNTTNKYADDPAAAKLGQMFFFEKAFSGPITTPDDGKNGGLGKVGETGKGSCASCHAGPWFIDIRSKPGNVSLAADWLPRNANTLVNAAYYVPWVENDGISDSMWSDALVDPEFNLALNGSRLNQAHVIYTKYLAEYNAVFDPDIGKELEDLTRFPLTGKPGQGAWDNMAPADQKIVNTIFANYGKAVEAYERLLLSPNSAFDRYVAGDKAAIGASAKNGIKLFVGKANCIACHLSNHFSDDDFHVDGMIVKGEHVVPEETGREFVIDGILANIFNTDGEFSDDRNTGRLVGLAETKAAAVGKWRTKGLRNVAMTPPYMHTGQLATLEDVVKFYNEGGDESGFVGVKDEEIKKLNLTATEVSDIVAFLEALTGDVVPAPLLEDTSKKN